MSGPTDSGANRWRRAARTAFSGTSAQLRSALRAGTPATGGRGGGGGGGTQAEDQGRRGGTGAGVLELEHADGLVESAERLFGDGGSEADAAAAAAAVTSVRGGGQSIVELGASSGGEGQGGNGGGFLEGNDGLPPEGGVWCSSRLMPYAVVFTSARQTVGGAVVGSFDLS